MSLRRLLRGLVPLLGLGIVLSATGCSGGDPAGEQWPDVDITDAQGRALRSDTVVTEGRPAIVTIWATSCAPCKEELPRLQSLAEEVGGVDVAAVNLGDDPGDIAAFAAANGLSLPIFIDSEGRLTEALGVVSVPATLFIGADGRILDRHLGALSAAELGASAAQLLGGTS